MNVGILAFHGDVAEHKLVLHKIGVVSKEIRTTNDLEGISHLIIPGGESTVIGIFLHETGLAELIVNRFHNNDLAIFGTCAGAILLANHVTGKNSPEGLSLLDVTIERNAYGTQAQSFQTDISVQGISEKLSVSFIRAPKIIEVGASVHVLSSCDGVPVVVQEGKVLAATCHPELCDATALHELFLAY